MSDVFALSDDLGPEKIIHINNPATRLQAIVVVDNTASGPSIGGTRMAPDVTLKEARDRRYSAQQVDRQYRCLIAVWLLVQSQLYRVGKTHLQ